MIARGFSWLLIVIGVGLGGFGAYQYFAARVSQSEEARDWTSGLNSEEPVPQSLPQLKSFKPLPYYDPYKVGDTVAKLTLPRLATTLFVVEGTDPKQLRRGPGHMPGTALPGVTGNCVIAGHRDTHFRALADVRKGDEVDLDTKYGHFRYEVQSLEVVSPDNVSSLYPTNDPVLHLVTCYPFHYVGHAPKRMVIEALLKPGQGSVQPGQ
jgi:sortase A